MAPQDAQAQRAISTVRGKHFCILHAADAKDKFLSYRQRDLIEVGQNGYGHQMRTAYNLANGNFAAYCGARTDFKLAIE